MRRRFLIWLFGLGLGVLASTAVLTSCRKDTSAVSREIVGIEVKSDNLKKTYGLRETLDPGDLEVVLLYSDGKSRSTTVYDPEVEYHGGSTEELGSHLITVSANGHVAETAYEVVRYHLILDMNGGSYEGQESVDLALDYPLVDLTSYIPVPADSAMCFAGWFFDRELTNRVRMEAPGQLKVAGSLTLYAGYDRDYSDVFTYHIEDDSVVLDSLNLFYMETEITIPATVELYPVVKIGDGFTTGGFFFGFERLTFAPGSEVQEIGDYAFNGVSISTVELPESLVNIGRGAFSMCDITAELRIPAGVKIIEDEAFSGNTRLEKVRFERGALTHIGSSAFAYNELLSEIVLPEGVRAIRTFAFSNCTNLRRVYLPSTVYTIGVRAFYGDPALQEIDVNPASKYYSSIDGNLYSADGTIFYRYCFGKTETVFAMSPVVQTIFEGAFECYLDYYTLRRIVLPEGLKTVAASAFDFCEAEFTLPASVRNIEAGAFKCWLGTGFQLKETNPYFKVKDGALYTYDMKDLIAVPCRSEVRHFVLDPKAETIRPYALAYSETLSTITIPETSSLKTVRESGLVIYNMSSLAAVYILKPEPFVLETDAFNLPGEYLISSVFAIYMDDQAADRYAEAWKDYRYSASASFSLDPLDAVVAKSNLETFISSVLSYEKIGYLPFADYREGKEPVISVAVTDSFFYDANWALICLEGLYRLPLIYGEDLKSYALDYERLIADLISSKFVQASAEERNGFALAFSAYSSHWGRLEAGLRSGIGHENELNALSEWSVDHESAREKLSSDVALFVLNGESFDRAKALGILAEYERLGSYNLALAANIYLRILMIQTVDMMLDFSEAVNSQDYERADLFYATIEENLSYQIVGENLQSQLYGYDRYLSDKALYEEAVR